MGDFYKKIGVFCSDYCVDIFLNKLYNIYSKFTVKKGGIIMGKVYGYCRCSTNESKQDIDGQKLVLRKLGVKDDMIFWEYGSGTKTDREQLNSLLSIISSGDTLVTTEVSRLSRSTKHLCEIIEIAQNKHIKLVIGNFVVDCSANELDTMTEGMLKMWGVFSEMERKMICSRVKYGIENARAKGKVLGRPKTNSENIPDIFYKYYPRYKSKQINITEFAKLCNFSRTTIYKYIDIVENATPDNSEVK